MKKILKENEIDQLTQGAGGGDVDAEVHWKMKFYTHCVKVEAHGKMKFDSCHELMLYYSL